MRGHWVEALCVLTLAVAALQLHGKERGTSFLTLPMLAGSKAAVIATTAPAGVSALPQYVIATRSDKP